MLHQNLEQCEFAGSERHILFVPGQAARGKIEAERAEFDDLYFTARRPRRRGCRAPPQHRLNARHQFAGIEGLGQVVVGADFEPDDAVDVVALGGKHDDGHVVVAAAQPPADGKPVLSRQHQVEHHQIVALAGELAIHVVAVGYGAHAEALLGEIAVEQIAQARVVIDDDAEPWIHSWPEC